MAKLFNRKESVLKRLEAFKRALPVLISLAVAIITVAMVVVLTNPTNQNGHKNPDNPNPDTPNMPKQELLWGVDSASLVTEDFYQCIVDNYGKPEAFGRYLGESEGVSAGITKEEAKRLHDKGTKIIPLHNMFFDATGYDKGQEEAKEAIGLAKDLDIPEGVYLFADIEPKTPIDADFLIGWTETILDSKYKAGAYGNYETDNLRDVYQTASDKSKAVKENLIIWANTPSTGVTSKEEAPNAFKANSPNLDHTLVWQYGLGGEKCNIDTDIIKNDIFDSLW